MRYRCRTEGHDIISPFEKVRRVGGSIRFGSGRERAVFYLLTAGGPPARME